MLSEISGANSADDGRAVFDAICDIVVAGQHFSWMSQIYVWCCDEAARFARTGGAIPSAYVYATHDALQCIIGCCTNHEGCARAFLYSEPVAYVTYMFYGLKLRISACDVLRPYEDDRPLKDTTTPAAAATTTEHPLMMGPQATTLVTGSSSRMQSGHLSSPAVDDGDGDAQLCSSPIPLRPSGARYLKTRYFGLLTANPASALSSPGWQQRRDSSVVVNCSAVASLKCPTPSPKAGVSTSWAFDLPGLTREQLKQLLLGGRENSFDALLFSALDVVVEVLRVTRDYSHWMVLSQISSLLLLCTKNIEVNPNVATTPPQPRLLSRVVAMYENIAVLFEFLLSLMQSLDSDTPTRCTGDSSSPDAEKLMGVRSTATDGAVTSKGEKRGRGGCAVPSGAFTGAKGGTPYAPSAQAGAGRAGVSTGPTVSTPAPECLSSSTTSPQDTSQLRETLSQFLVHLVLQTDVHALVAATTRVLQCDRTLFRVLHRLCVLDAREMEKPKLPPKAAGNDNSNMKTSSGGESLAGRRCRNASQGPTLVETASVTHSSAAGGGMNASRPAASSLRRLSSAGSHNPSRATTFAPRLSVGAGARGGRVHSLDDAAIGGGAVFDAAASFFMTANYGDLRQMVNEVGSGGSSETPSGGGVLGSGPSGDLGGSQSFLRGIRGSGLSGVASFCNASQRRHSNVQMLQKRHQVNHSPGAVKKNSSGGENFAKSFFKSFFGSAKKGGSLFTRGITNDVDEEVEGNSDNEGSLDGSSASAGSSSSFSGDSGDSGGSGDGDSDNHFLGSSADRCGMGSPLMPGSFVAASGGGLALRRSNIGAGSPRRPPLSPKEQRECHRHRHRRSRATLKPQYSPWRDVPSYTALVSEFVRILNLVLADEELSIDVRLGAGLLLPGIVLRDNQVFRLYEGRVLIRNYLSLLLQELRYSVKLQPVADDHTSLPQRQQPQTLSGEVPSQGKTASAELVQGPASPPLTVSGGGSGSAVDGRTHLTQRELVVFASRVIDALEQTFKVLGATPLTSDVASLTELPLNFFCVDGAAPFGLALERSFTRVVVLWLIGLVGAQCDEDIDKHAMETLLHLMNRANTRGSLPRDSGTTLVLNTAGTATVVQISSALGTAVPTAVLGPQGMSAGDCVESRRLFLGDDVPAAGDGGGSFEPSAPSAKGLTPLASSGPVATSLASGRTGPVMTSTCGSASVPSDLLRDCGDGDVGGLHCSHMMNSLFGNNEFAGLAAAASVDRAMAECGNTVEALGSVFRVLLGRSPDLLTPAGLATVQALFASHDSNVSRLGRECIMHSLEMPSSYALYADVICDSDTFTLTQTLSVISAYLNSSVLTPVARHERRVWLQRSGCVDAVVRVLVRVLDSPHSTPVFMKIIPHLFQLLSAFESVDHKPPQLSNTNFVAALTERLAILEGTEYFIIVTQAVLDACMGTYGGVDGGYANVDGPGAHYTEMHVVGHFHIAQHNCAAEKPVFLELLPPLLRFAEKHNAQLYHELVEVLFRILECTGNVRSDRLADFLLDHGLSQMLPYLELSGPYIEERLPFTGSAKELHRFWQPVLLRAPRRSELRFTSYGGVQISVGTWPDTGFTIGAWFKFDRLYTTIPLFEFHGVMSDNSSGCSSSWRGTSSLTALLFIFGGDSVQLTLNDARRTTVNESQALQNFVPNKWTHICVVLRTTQVLDVYVSGFKVGTTTFPAFSPATEVRVNVGCTDELLCHPYGSGTGLNAAPLFSMSDVTLWGQALSRAQVEAELAGGDFCAAGSDRPVIPAKIVEEAIPQELTMIQNMGSLSAGTAGGPPGLAGGNFAGFAALINPKPTSNAGGGTGSNPSMGAGHDARGVLGMSFSITASGSAGAGAGNNSNNAEDIGGMGIGGSGWASAQSCLPISTRMARFVPHENDDNLLRNVLSSSATYPVVAKLVGRYAAPPKTWVDYPLLWATRGGVMRLLDWLHLVTSSAQLEGLMQLLTECFLRTTLAVTLEARTYMLFAYMLTHHVAAFFTNAACDHLLTLASSHMNVFDEEHRIILNRLAVEHILGNVAFYAAIPLNAALYLLQRVRHLFSASQCRYARHNARFVIPYRFVDRLLHSLINVAAQTPPPLRRAVVQVAQQVVIACEMEESLLQIFVSLAALLTPDETTVVSRFNPRVKVTLPAMNSMTHRKHLLSLRTANHLTTLLLASLVECTQQGAFITALARTVDLPWYAACLSRFADPASVVYATRIFFEAVEHNPPLQEEAMHHQSAIIEALMVHAADEDLLLLLLAQSVGVARHVDVLSHKHSLLRQLDGVMNTCQTHPNPLVAPIFAKIFVAHLYRTMHVPRRQATRLTALLPNESRLFYRVRRYFSLIRVCSRISLFLRIKRYHALLVHQHFTSSSHTPVLGTFRLRHLSTRSAGILSSTTPNVSFAHGAVTGNPTSPTNAMLGNCSFASNAHASGMGAGSISSHQNIPFFVLNPQGREAMMNSGEGGGVLPAVTSETPSLAGRSSAGGGDGCPDDGDLQSNRGAMTGHSDTKQFPQLLLPPFIRGVGESSAYSGEEEGVDEAVPQWNPPVLLPDMLPVPAAPMFPVASQQMASRTSSQYHHPLIDSPATTDRSSANISRMTPPISLSASPTNASAGAQQLSMGNGKQVGEHVSSSGNSGTDDDDEERRASSQFFVHSHKYKRAFAVLRVCVLLWLPIQVRRSRWVFTARTQLYEEDYAKRHASTLFCIRMFRYFASFPSNFYLFVNSPLQIGALSSLVPYIGPDMLVEESDTWNQIIRTMTGVPARESAAADNSAIASVVPGSPTVADTPTSKGLSAFPQGDSDAAHSGDNTMQQQQQQVREGEGQRGEESGEEVIDGGVAAIADAAMRGSGSIAALAFPTGDAIEPKDTSAASPLNESAPARPAGSPNSAILPMPQLSSMASRSSELPAAQLNQMAGLEPPEGSMQVISDVEDGIASSMETASRMRHNSGTMAVVGEPSVNEADASRLPNMSFDVEGPPLITTTRIPLRRITTQQQLQGASASPQSSTSATADSSPSLLEKSDEAAVTANVATARAAAAAPADLSVPAGLSGTRVGALSADAVAAAASVRGAPDNEVDEKDDSNDDSSSVSSTASFDSVSSRSSVASANSVPIIFSGVPKPVTAGATARKAPPSGPANVAAKKAFGAPVPPLSNLHNSQHTLLACDTPSAYAGGIAKETTRATEVVQRDSVGILKSLIRSSLDTLPVPHWTGGPTYGSCGGLLFQLLLVVSAKAAVDEATTTLVQYFLLTVGNAVKEQRDRELALPLRQDPAASLRGAHSTPPVAPMLPGLGNASFGHGAIAASPLPSLSSHGLSGFNGNGVNLISQSGSSDGPLGGANMSFAFSAMLPPSLLPAGSVAAPRHIVQPTITQRAGSSEAAQLEQSQASHPSSGAGALSDVFLFNINHFTDLIVDMLAINVLDLPMATHYFLTLLMLCQTWPSRYIDQLSWQVMRACIAVLNRPSMQDASVSLIESIYTLTTLVLRRGWKHKGALECLFRVLYRVYGSLPPAWMSDEDARHRKRLIALIFRHVVQTYSGTKELEKALTVRTLTQRLSLYEDFVMIFSMPNEGESVDTFERYCVAQSSSIETLMSGRLKTKADLAFKASIKTRSEYIKRIKAFNSQYVGVTEVAERYRKAALKNAYASRFSSYVATPPVLDGSQLHWLLSSTCALRGDHCATGYGIHTSTTTSAATAKGRDGCGEVTLYHFLDSQLNYGEFKSVLWGKERVRNRSSSSNNGASHHVSTSEAAAPPALSSANGSQHSISTASSVPSPPLSTHCLSAASNSSEHEAGRIAVGAETEPEADDEQPAKNDLARVAQCEEVVQHIAVLLPPFSTRCRPHIGDEAFPMSLKNMPFVLTPSAMTLLRYLLAPHETLRFISNGFHISGIHATPCLIILTSTTLKVIGFSRVTETGDIVLCEYEDEDEDEAPSHVSSNNNINDTSSPNTASPDADSKILPTTATRKNIFSVSSMTKQFQKLFTDNSTKRRQQQDGTRVAQAVRQVMGRNSHNIFWSYLVSSIRTVRSLRYMHLDTAVQLQLYYDEGPMLSVVDAKQSMNPSARKEFIKVLKDVVTPQQCTFVDETQRAASMKSNLVRWATGALSNYEYLRFLNEVAGRTNRDLNQYPIFPWVLADYASATLDLEASSTFRNFGYPMGAQTEARRRIVAQLFENTREVRDVDTGKSYPFHHGTHYSTSGGVLYFLLRVQPFTTYARLFQGGDFDLAMRLFDSISASFSSCVMGPADCKELIPEFYASNGFLANADHLQLGLKSDGQPVDDVRLPPWAKNSRQVFTAVMRYALESCYVVEHLHQWIDLVFGVRRRGPLAMERYNVFQRMTYGEEVVQALKDAETPRDCDVIIAEVDNFGQTPPQLFQERHPSQQELMPVVQGYAADGGAAGHGTGSGGGGGNANNSSGNNGGSTGRSVPPSASSMSAITLGGLYTSTHSASSTAGAGTQLGATFSNLLSSGTFASGQTYTQAFRREAPKVVRLLLHAMDETQSWFVLRDPPSSAMQHPPPPMLADNFCGLQPAILNFSPLRTSRKLACAYAQLVPVPHTDHYLCWHEREARLMRYTAGQGTFLSTVVFNPPDESGARISAVAVGTRESVLLIAISTGAVYCLFPDDILNGTMQLRVTLCYHRNPVEKIVLDSVRRRAVTVTRGHRGDEPTVWRVQRSGCSFLFRLSMEHLQPTPIGAEKAATGQTAQDAKDAGSAVDVAVDSVSGYIAVVTARSLVIFDDNGEPFGAGTLPSPNSVRAVDSVTLRDDNGDVGVVVGRAVVVMPNLSAVTFYQTREWAAGMSVLITGHTDGSVSVWRCTRLPPDTVKPGSIAMVEYHTRLFSGAANATSVAAAAAAAGGGSGQDGGASLSRKMFFNNAGGTARTTASIGTGASTVNAALASTISSAGCVGTGTGATNCPVTCLYQERVDVPMFLVGYENGSTRQLVFDEPVLIATGVDAGGAGGGRDSGGDDRGQRR
ncbi:hypothetical protein ABL78_3576 [Leptomonas seymouri]|uniref:BEACH domain-containing protein n=1 Tax=Leptomonas seymouri TaxID=5684 RepID=A0A0N1PEL4_LEPSE|nr:hypothetical protein ABL78_3576 [Leptomonas seymouri]|eukprot:KPI87335.1 hypothetical protein ABL78_3576 [Leptomonas seymouri]